LLQIGKTLICESPRDVELTGVDVLTFVMNSNHEDAKKMGPCSRTRSATSRPAEPQSRHQQIYV